MHGASAIVKSKAPFAAWAAERLHSWKEIASFFGKEVRTVQLWEKSEGLPVRRQHHKKLGSVYAYRAELERWWMARSGIGSRALPGPQAAETCAPSEVACVAPAHLGSVEGGPAFHACILGLHFWKQRTRGDLWKALGYFEDAILIDPSCADAYAGLTDTYISLSYNHCLPAQEATAAAQRAISMALQLEPKSINVRNAAINFYTTCMWRCAVAERACRELVDAGQANTRTLQLYAALMIRRGRPEEAIRLAMHAHRNEPCSDSVNSQASFAYFYAGDYDNAVSFIQRAIHLRPLCNTGHALLGRAEAERGKWDRAIESFERGLALSSDPPFLKALLAYGYAGRGDALTAGTLLREIEEHCGDACFPAVDVSAVYAMLNQTSQAMRYLSKAYDLGDLKLAFIRYDPRFTHLRHLPRFQQIASLCMHAPVTGGAGVTFSCIS